MPGIIFLSKMSRTLLESTTKTTGCVENNLKLFHIKKAVITHPYSEDTILIPIKLRECVASGKTLIE